MPNRVPRTRLVAAIFCAALLILTLPVAGKGAEPTGAARPIRCVYFSPADCEPNPDRAERLFRVMSYVQEFYRAEMERNGFGPATTFGLEESAPGKLKLHEVKAPGLQSDYGRESFGEVRRIVGEALAKEGIDANREVVAIFQQGLRWNEDGSATEVASFVGMGTPFYGAGTFYDDLLLDPENFTNNEPGGYYGGFCTIGEFNTHYIGGVAHELGHALTLPHDCETSAERRELGAALMGGGNHTFGQELRGKGKGAFLTRSEALRLSVVPAISGKEPRRLRAEDVRLVELNARRVSRSAVEFSGRIEAPRSPRALIFYEDLDSRGSDYDAKSWTTTPGEDGTFSVTLTEVAPEPSELRICAVRDFDTIELLRASYDPDGSANEFEPLESRLALTEISSAFARRDAAGLDALAKGKYADSEKTRALCQELARTLEGRPEPTSPGAAEGQSFDLTDARFDAEKVGWARMTRGMFFDGSVLCLGDRGYSSGLCAHANSSLVTTLGGKWQTLSFGYGLQAGGGGSVVFMVRGDGKELFRSELVRDHARHDATISVEGVRVLELATEDGGDGGTADHSIWVEPTLAR